MRLSCIAYFFEGTSGFHRDFVNNHIHFLCFKTASVVTVIGCLIVMNVNNNIVIKKKTGWGNGVNVVKMASIPGLARIERMYWILS